MPSLQLRWFKSMLNNQSLIARLKKITLVVTDVDGSLTDGTVHYNSEGEADRMYSPQDGYVMRMAIKQGIRIAFLSGNSGESIMSRAKKLQLPAELVITGSRDKRAAVKQLQAATNATSEQTLIFGDDVLDSVVKEADPKVFFAMPKNGIFYIKHFADCVVPVNAGSESALRLLLDLILYVQGTHETQHLITSALESNDEKNSCSCTCGA
jgi:3-deoxy-D-manno-octulosonate 8-phosphate phosphatase (KDO 8-P phosphatase)